MLSFETADCKAKRLGTNLIHGKAIAVCFQIEAQHSFGSHYEALSVIKMDPVKEAKFLRSFDSAGCGAAKLENC